MILKTFTYHEDKIKKTIKVKKVQPYSTGLMFRKNSPNLLFSLKEEQTLDITSIFCRPFKALWLDKNKKVIQSLNIKQWKMRIPGRGMYLLEIPISKIAPKS